MKFFSRNYFLSLSIQILVYLLKNSAHICIESLGVILCWATIRKQSEFSRIPCLYIKRVKCLQQLQVHFLSEKTFDPAVKCHKLVDFLHLYVVLLNHGLKQLLKTLLRVKGNNM